MRTRTLLIHCLLAGCMIAGQASAGADKERLLRGEVLFESLQGNHLEALLKLNTSQPLTSGWPASSARSMTELRLEYGLSELTDKSVRKRGDNRRNTDAQNLAAYTLAWFYYDEGNPAQALQTLEMIRGDIDGTSLDDVQYLRALAYLGLGKFQAATRILGDLSGSGDRGAYVRYNLAMAQLQSGNESAGRSTLAALGQIQSKDADILALRDLANLKLGHRYLQENRPEQAKAAFNRIRLDGPFSNQALLGAGWASFAMGKFDRAIVAWKLLNERQTIDNSVIEAKMALPYAYSKLGAHGRAANLYARTIELFDAELARLAASSEAIEGGDLRRAVMRELESGTDDWFIGFARHNEQQLYLPLLLANDEFRRLADSLHELALLEHRLKQARDSARTGIKQADARQKSTASILAATRKELKTIDEQMKRMSPPSGQQGATAESSELARLQSTRKEVLKLLDATVRYQQQLPKSRRQLEDLSKRLERLDKQLKSEINRIAGQMESVAQRTLALKYKQLESYRANALFALAESYEFATGKQE